MNINFLSPVLFKNLKNKNINFTSNPITNSNSSLKSQLPEDTFEKRENASNETNIAQSIKEIDDKIEALNSVIGRYCLRKNKISSKTQENEKWYTDGIAAIEERRKLKSYREALVFSLDPNLVFLNDKKKSWSKKEKMISESHPEIIIASSLDRYEENSPVRALFLDNRYFVVQKLNNRQLLDSSFEINTENYKKLASENSYSYPDFCKKFGFSTQELERYLKEGFLERLTLLNLLNNNQDTVDILDASSSVSAKGIKRHEEIKYSAKESPFISKKWVPIKHLSVMGFGTEEKLAEYARDYKIQTKMVPFKTKEGIKEFLCVSNERKLEGVLHYLRNQNKDIIDINELTEITNMDITDVEDAILDGKIKCIPYYIFKCDKGKVLFDLADKKNIEFIGKKNIEYSYRNRGFEN